MIIIRSQSQEAVGKYVEVIADENVIKGFSAYGHMTVLGAYESRERAIQLINRIHECLLAGINKDYLDRNYRIKQDTVFKMPPK